MTQPATSSARIFNTVLAPDSYGLGGRAGNVWAVSQDPARHTKTRCVIRPFLQLLFKFSSGQTHQSLPHPHYANVHVARAKKHIHHSQRTEHTMAGSPEQSQQGNVGNAAQVVVLVTGGCGYVGTHTVLKLLEQNVRVVVVDNLAGVTRGSDEKKPASLERVEELAGKTANFHNVDIGDAEALDKIFKLYRFDCVIHLAALKSVGDSCSLPLDYYRNNVAGTVTLLETMKSHQVMKLVFSSSATVYGEPQYLPVDEQHVTGQRVTNPYGRTKYFIEEILRDLCTSDPKWSVICLRYFNPVGAHPSGRIGEDPAGVPCNLMPYVAQVAVGRLEKLAVYGNDYSTPDGTGVRDYIHIMDLAEGHWAATKKVLKEKGAKGEGAESSWLAYNLGLGRGYSVLDVVKCFESVSGRPIAVDFVKRRDGDVASSYSDCSLAGSQLDWKASRTLTDMCRDMWKWQSINPNGYQSN